MKENRLNKLEKFLKETFPERIQSFTTNNIAGDCMKNIYNEDNISIDFCYKYNYIEIFGLTDEEYLKLVKLGVIY